LEKWLLDFQAGQSVVGTRGKMASARTLKRYNAAALAYEQCPGLDPTHADAHFNLARLSEIRGDKQGLVRHLNA
jgi:hypothetical protein